MVAQIEHYSFQLLEIYGTFSQNVAHKNATENGNIFFKHWIDIVYKQIQHTELYSLQTDLFLQKLFQTFYYFSSNLLALDFKTCCTISCTI